MSYQLLATDPAPGSVRRMTFVPFLPDGRCVAVLTQGGEPRLPAGAVRPGEDDRDACLRIPLMTAGFRYQFWRPFAADGDHFYAWIDGNRYRGRRAHVDAEWIVGPAEEVARRLSPDEERAVRDAAASRAALTDEEFYARNARLLEGAYLRGTTPEAGSGFGGTPADWRAKRESTVDGINRDGTFLDVGCANGLLMESMRDWALERGLRIEPYGVDISPRLAERARGRLPDWADRIEVGNAIDHRPADGRRFTFVHARLDMVLSPRRGELVRHLLDELVEPRGRLLVTHQGADHDRSAAGHLRALGHVVAGQSGDTAWVERRP